MIINLINFINNNRPFTGLTTANGIVLPIRTITTTMFGDIEIYELALNQLTQPERNLLKNPKTLLWAMVANPWASLLYHFQGLNTVSGYTVPSLNSYINDIQNHDNNGGLISIP